MYKYGILLLILVVVVGVFTYQYAWAPSDEANTTQPESALNNKESASKPSTSQTTKSTTPAPPVAGAQGNVVVAITDAVVSLDSIKSILLTVNEVSIHHETNGWVTISKTPRTFDLLQLHALDINQLFGEASVGIGTYNQIRLVIGNISVVSKSNANPQIAKLPSGDLRINGKLTIAKGETSGIIFDFLADKSLHTASNGKYIFAPVVLMRTESNIRNVQKLSDRVDLFSGNTTFVTTMGMNEKGELAQNFSFSYNEKLDIVDDKIILSK